MTSNPHEELARLRKAVTLADCIDAMLPDTTGLPEPAVTACIDGACKIPASGCLETCQFCGVTYPSDATKILVAELLKARRIMRQRVDEDARKLHLVGKR